MKLSRRDFIKTILLSSGALCLPLSSVFALPVEQKLLRPFDPNVRKRKNVESFYKEGQEREVVEEHIRLLEEWSKDYIPHRDYKKVEFWVEFNYRDNLLVTTLDYNPAI